MLMTKATQAAVTADEKVALESRFTDPSDALSCVAANIRSLVKERLDADLRWAAGEGPLVQPISQDVADELLTIAAIAEANS